MRYKMFIKFCFLFFLGFANIAKATSVMYVGSTSDDKLYIYEINSFGHVLAGTVQVGKNPRGVAVSPDGSRVYVVNKDSKTVSVIDAASHQKITDINVGNSPESTVIDPDGSRLFVVNVKDNNVSVIDTKKVGIDPNPILVNLPVGSDPAGIAIGSYNGQKRLHVANWTSGTISNFDISSSNITPLDDLDLKNIPHPNNAFERPKGIATKDQYLYITHNENKSPAGYFSVFFETPKGISYLTTTYIKKGAVKDVLPEQLIVSKDFKYLWVASSGIPSISIFNVENNNKSIISLERERQNRLVTGLSISSDGSNIYTINKDDQICKSTPSNNDIQFCNVNIGFKTTETTGQVIGPEITSTIKASPESVDFGKQSLNSSIPPQTVTLNFQYVPTRFKSLKSRYSNNLTITHDCTKNGWDHAVGDSCTYTIDVQSNQVGDIFGEIEIETDTQTLKIPIKGTIEEAKTPTPPDDNNGGGNKPGDGDQSGKDNSDKSVGQGEGSGGCAILSSEIPFTFPFIGILWFIPFVYFRFKKIRGENRYRL